MHRCRVGAKRANPALVPALDAEIHAAADPGAMRAWCGHMKSQLLFSIHVLHNYGHQRCPRIVRNFASLVCVCFRHALGMLDGSLLRSRTGRSGVSYRDLVRFCSAEIMPHGACLVILRVPRPPASQRLGFPAVRKPALVTTPIGINLGVFRTPHQIGLPGASKSHLTLHIYAILSRNLTII